MELVHRHDITAIATLGEQGYCGHTDHIATHNAATLAVEQLRQRGRHVGLLSLDHEHDGALRTAVNTKRKLAGLTIHASQMNYSDITHHATDFWQSHAHYTPLLFLETYFTPN